MVGAFWGIFSKKEFAGGGKRVSRLNFLMFPLFPSIGDLSRLRRQQCRSRLSRI
jgi:hypothetical protein